MLLKVDEQKVSSSFNDIHDGLQSILNDGFKSNLLVFVNCFDLGISERIFFGLKNMNNALESYFSSR
jgi:hypothetical protein